MARTDAINPFLRDFFECDGEMRHTGPLRHIESGARMNTAVGARIFGDYVVLAELLLHDAAALCLLGTRETRPVHEKTLTAYQATDIAAFM